MSTVTKKIVRRTFTILEKLGIEFLLMLCILGLGTFIMHIYENVGYFDSWYFSVITLAGIGYGDIVPHTVMGKIVAMVYGIIGIPLFIVAGSLLVELLTGSNKDT